MWHVIIVDVEMEDIRGRAFRIDLSYALTIKGQCDSLVWDVVNAVTLLDGNFRSYGLAFGL